MDIATFWQLIDEAREAGGGDPRKQSALLVEILARLPENEIIEFDNLFTELMDKAYTADLWDAAFIINCGCSDDGFSEFREWLIGRGREIFDNALADPESLVNVAEFGNKAMYPTFFIRGHL